MQKLVRSALLGALAFAPAAAFAQVVIEEPPLVIGEPVVGAPAMVGVPVVGVPVVGVPVIGPAGVTEADARAIAMFNGMVEVEDVDHRIWDGDFEVDGEDASGDDLEITIDGQTGAVLEIDD